MQGRRNVQQTVIKALGKGLVLTTEKTKAGSEGGRQTVTVGPRRTAVADGYRYQAIYWRKGAQVEDAYHSTHDLARDYIAFVGRDLAYKAAMRALAQGR